MLKFKIWPLLAWHAYCQDKEFCPDALFPKFTKLKTDQSGIYGPYLETTVTAMDLSSSQKGSNYEDTVILYGGQLINDEVAIDGIYMRDYYFATRKILNQEYDKIEVVEGQADERVKPVDIQYMFDIDTGLKDPAKARALL